jgi:cell wall-associated NlpC family hydrolase
LPRRVEADNLANPSRPALGADTSTVRLRLVIGLVFLACAALGATAAAPGAPTPAERAQQSRARAVLGEIQSLDAQMEHVVNAWDEANARLASLDLRVRENRRSLKVARVQLRVARRRLARRVLAVYENGEPTLGDVVLGATSLSQVIERAQLANYVLKEDSRTAAVTEAARQRFMRRARRLSRAETQQRKNVAQLTGARATIAQSLSRRRALLGSIQSQIAQLQAEQRAHERALAFAARARIASEQRARATRAAHATTAHQTTTPEAPAPTATTIRPTTSEATTTAPTPTPVAPALGGGHPDAASIAARYLGIPYKWGGSSPATGFDCSGLVMYVYAQLGISLPHYTGAQWGAGVPVSRSQLEPGDLVFFDGLGHVGIYIGGGQFIHAPHTGDVVRVSSLSDSWYSSHYDGARRIP